MINNDLLVVVVITSNLDNFEIWRKLNFNESDFDGLNTSTKFRTKKAKYIGIISARQLCGYFIDSVIYLEDAKLNPNYSEIINELKHHIKNGNKLS